MLVPAEHEGGSVTDQPLVDLVVLAEELGRELNPGPVRARATSWPTPSPASGPRCRRKEHLPRIARGEATVRLVPERRRVARALAPSRCGRRAPATAGGSTAWPATSTPRATPPCSSSRRRTRRATASSTCWCRAPSPGLSDRVLTGLDLTRRFAEVRFDGVVGARPARSWPAAGTSSSAASRWPRSCRRPSPSAPPTVLFAATVDYAKKRVQFGRTIGSFQAIKHRLADLLMELEGMRAAAHYAALALGDGLPDAAEAVATAGAYVDDAFAHLSGEALQLHGGIGFTWEHDVHLFVRRAKVNQVLYGDGAWHRERLTRLFEAAATQGEGG